MHHSSQTIVQHVTPSIVGAILLNVQELSSESICNKDDIFYLKESLTAAWRTIDTLEKACNGDDTALARILADEHMEDSDYVLMARAMCESEWNAIRVLESLPKTS